MKLTFTNELEKCLIGDSFAAPPTHILEGLDEALALREFANVPRTIYAELWHITFWMDISHDWVTGHPTPNPGQAALGFPAAQDVVKEPWPELVQRFFGSLEALAAVARDASRFETIVECPSPPGYEGRYMSVREQLESAASHNAYHFGRIVLMRQMAGSWPPKSGGFTW